MIALLDFFPFNLPPGFEFLVLWAVLTAGVWSLCLRGERWLVDTAEPVSRPAAPSPISGGYRQPASDGERGPLRIGVLPQGAQLWTVAWIRGAHDGVAEALVATAEARGMVLPVDADGTEYRLAPADARPRDPVVRTFRHILAAAPSITPFVLRESGLTAARVHEGDFDAELTRAGFVRSRELLAKITAVMVAGLLLVELVAALRILAQADPDSSMSALLLAAMLTVALVFPVYRPSRRHKSRRRREYLRWLRGATVALVDHVSAADGPREPADVTLAAAVGGVRAITKTSLASPFLAAQMPKPRSRSKGDIATTSAGF